MNLTKSILLTLFILATRLAQAQSSGGSKPTLDAQLLAGTWVSADSFKYKIEFVDTNYQITLRSVPPDYLYYFIKDSTGRVSPSGYYPQWPPPGCDLQLLAGDTLQLSYSQLGVPLTMHKFVKQKF